MISLFDCGLNLIVGDMTDIITFKWLGLYCIYCPRVQLISMFLNLWVYHVAILGTHHTHNQNCGSLWYGDIEAEVQQLERTKFWHKKLLKIVKTIFSLFKQSQTHIQTNIVGYKSTKHQLDHGDAINSPYLDSGIWEKKRRKMTQEGKNQIKSSPRLEVREEIW